MKPIHMPNGRVVFKTKEGSYYDPVTMTYLNQDEENMLLKEKAPPSKKAEDWIKSNKAEFKKQYGKDYKRVLYATAWKMFGESLNEHANTDYIEPWKDQGFDIQVQDTVRGKEFTVTKDNSSYTIIEPEDGVYNIFGKSFNDFDSAISEIIKSKFSDINVTESLRKLAGLK